MKSDLLLKYASAGLLAFSIWFACCKKEGSARPASSTPYSSGSGGDSTGSSFPVTQVFVFNYHFSPTNITIGKGTSVSWTNKDSISHTVSSETGIFDSGDLGPGKNFFVTFPNTGTFYYHCKYHKEGGKVVVY